MMESRSNSFSGPIEEAQEKAPANKRQHMIDSNGNSTNSGSGSNGIEGMFLRMPVRHDSPISAAVKKKALMTRCNMSDGIVSDDEIPSAERGENSAFFIFLAEHHSDMGGETW